MIRTPEREDGPHFPVSSQVPRAPPSQGRPPLIRTKQSWFPERDDICYHHSRSPLFHFCPLNFTKCLVHPTHQLPPRHRVLGARACKLKGEGAAVSREGDTRAQLCREVCPQRRGLGRRLGGQRGGSECHQEQRGPGRLRPRKSESVCKGREVSAIRPLRGVLNKSTRRLGRRAGLKGDSPGPAVRGPRCSARGWLPPRGHTGATRGSVPKGTGMDSALLRAQV